MSHSKEVDLALAQRAIPCDACDDEIPGTYYCGDCKKTLCEDCEKAHNKFTKGHKVVLRTQIGHVDTSILTCADHGDGASFHCEECNIPVCPECVTGKHQGHKMASLNKIIEKKKELLQGQINKIKNVVVPKLEQQQEAIKAERENYNKRIEEVTKEMERENELLHNELDRVHQERLKIIHDTQQMDLVLIDNQVFDVETKVEVFNKRASDYEDAIEKNSFASIYKLSERKEPVIQTRFEPLIPSPLTFIPADMKDVIEKLGRLEVDSSSLPVKELTPTTPTIVSKFKCPLKGFPRICITKEGDVWLGGSEARELVQVDMNGQILKKRSIETKPYMLAVMECGDIVMITNSESSASAIRLLSDGREQKVFDPSPHHCCGISVTHDQKILLCLDTGSVLLTNIDGANTKQIYKGSSEISAIHAIENTDGNIYITSWSKSAVLIVSKEGKILPKITKSVTGEKLQRPLTSVLDSMGNILCSDHAKHCVYIIDQHRQVRELVTRSFGIEKPRDLAIDNKNFLWITHSDGNVLVLKYLY